jgi:formylglycine-generating enzyme required for sulfatase activity
VRKRVTPRPGLQQLIEFSLQTEQEARAARIKPQITTALGQTLLLFNPADSPRSEFTMGASRREPGRRANEVLHPVALERSFYLQTTEVTNAQFRQFQADHDSGQIEGNSLNREHQPVVQISWQQATQFCNWLSRREGLPPFYRQTNGIVTGYNPSSTGYRLPTEAEWAWAARVENDSLKKFTWGDDFPPTSAVENYADNTSAYVTGRILNGYTDGHVVSAPVATFPPTGKGLYDLGGNVAEWIHDVYTIPSANGTTEVDPLGSQSGDNFVIRGASWSLSKLTELRLSFRDYGQAGRDDVGFRIARYAE